MLTVAFSIMQTDDAIRKMHERPRKAAWYVAAAKNPSGDHQGEAGPEGAWAACSTPGLNGSAGEPVEDLDGPGNIFRAVGVTSTVKRSTTEVSPRQERGEF